MQFARKPRSPVDGNGTFRLRSPPRFTENDVERACLQLCALRGYWSARLHCGKYRTMDGKRVITMHKTGTPDYALAHELYPGFLLEVKRPGELPSPEQELKHWELRGGYRLAISVVDSAADLSRWLKHEARARTLWSQLVGQARAP